MKEIRVTQSSLPPIDDYYAEIKDIWESKWLTNSGSKHAELADRLKSFLNADNITLFTNGHLALECLIASMGLTGEVITTPFTFASTSHAIVRNGLKPVFCDIDPGNCTMDAEKIEALITRNTSAIIPVHVYGNICDVEKIEILAAKYGLKVLYDAAHAFGVKYKGKSVATFGDASMYSFHATKVFHTIEGGAVVYADAGLGKTLDALKNFGITGLDHYGLIGGNAKMNEFQAAMGLCNLKYLDREIEKRGKVVERYRLHLEGVPGVRILLSCEDTEPNHAYFPVLFDGFKWSRDEVYDLLTEQGIFARKYFYPLVSTLDGYGGVYDANSTPNAQHCADHVLTLPLYSELALTDVDRICELILR